MLYPAHCGHRKAHGYDFYGRELVFDRCFLHESAMLGRGTDMAYCTLTKATPGHVARTGPMIPGAELRLVQRQGASLTLHQVTFLRYANEEALLDVPAASFCPGDSGSPVIQIHGGFVTVVAFASSAKRSADCHAQGEIRAIPLGVALQWVNRVSPRGVPW